MAEARTEALDMFESHPSLSASLEDFEHNERPVPFRYPTQRSGFRSDSSEAGLDSNSEGPWSPQGWKNQTSAGSGWYRHQPYLQESPAIRSSHSRENSFGKHSVKDDDDPTMMPANIPLPRGSVSPNKEVSPSPAPNGAKSGSPEAVFKLQEDPGDVLDDSGSPGSPHNYIRFSLRADMQHKTEPFEAALANVRSIWNHLTRSRTSTLTTVLVTVFSFTFLRFLTQSPYDEQMPDLLKVAEFAKSFEPMIYYSENGIKHISDLQETGVAVWDLGESVRAANMTSAPIIVRELDELAESLKVLGTQLTSFFATVDGDIDNILLVMDWARRELGTLTHEPYTPLSSAMSNVHILFSRFLYSSTAGKPTHTGQLLATLLGATSAQRTRHTLHRTFVELISTLEESINDEITHTTKLFHHFSIIDGHFLNLQRSTVRELDSQENAEGELLASMWQYFTSSDTKSRLRKYDKNKKLLQEVRNRTTKNKKLISDHSIRLSTMQDNLETLRRRLMKPLIRGEGSSVSVVDQIRGLESTHDFLSKVRQEQKGRVMERLYGGGGRLNEIGGS